MISMVVSENYTRQFSIPKLHDGNIVCRPYASPMGFKDRLREARDSAGLSGEKLGQKLAVSKATISHWENARYEPSLAQLRALCDQLGVTADWLIEREESALSAEALAEARAFEALPSDQRRKWKAMRLTMFSAA